MGRHGARSAMLLLILVLSSCSLLPAGDPEGTSSYHVRGRAVDATGAPLSGVEVFAENTAKTDSRVAGLTNNDGVYDLDLSGHEPSSWRVSAQLNRIFHEVHHTFALYPKETEQFAGQNGAVRDFEWHLSGATPAGGYYGGQVFVIADLEQAELDPAEAELTFTPVGELVDGSTGKTFSMVPPDGRIVPDVPVGRYQVSAKLTDGKTLKVRVLGKGEYAAEVTADFVETEENDIALELEISR